jgi:GNAT superfamily N-acetyltransferase
MEAWREDLSPGAASIAAQPTWVAELDGELAGFCQLNLQAGPAELEHLWVRPQFMRHGIGRALLDCALHELAVSGVDVLHIDADPHAEPFYLACGAVRVGALAAPVEGEPGRVRPQMRLSTADRIAATGDTRLRQEPR